MDCRAYWENELQSVVECYSDEYAEEIGINKLTEDDMNELANIVMNDDELWQKIDARLQAVIETYCNRKYGG